MFSLNVPLPPAVGRLADDLQSKLSGFDRVRDRHTLVCKRFGVADVIAGTDASGSADAATGGSTDAATGGSTDAATGGSTDAATGGNATAATNASDPPPRPVALDRLRDRLRPLLGSVDPFAVAVVGIDAFEAPTSGSGPVVYLDVESDALVRLHRRLCADYGAIEGIEGAAYVPHVTLARGGEPAAASRLVDADVEFDPIRWRVHALDLYDPEFREVAATLGL